MSALAIAHPRTDRPRSAAHLRPVPPRPPEPPVLVPVSPEPPVRGTVSTEPVRVTISIDGGAPAGRERVLAALRDLVHAAGAGAEVALELPVAAPADGALRLDPRARTATLGGRPLDLSRLEFDLLAFLALHPRQVFTRSQLLAQVWGHTHTTNRTVDVHVSRLRTKLAGPEVVTTVYGLGYRLADDAAVLISE